MTQYGPHPLHYTQPASVQRRLAVVTGHAKTQPEKVTTNAFAAATPNGANAQAEVCSPQSAPVDRPSTDYFMAHIR